MSKPLSLEKLLENLAVGVIKRPKMSLWLCLLGALLMSIGMSQMYVDVTNESMFRDDDPALTQFRQFQSQFGRDDAALAAIESDNIFSREFFNDLEAYHLDLENSLPYLDKVTSLVSVTSVSDNNGEILIDDLKNIWPESDHEFGQFKQDVVNNPLYRNLVISEDGNVTLLVVRASAFATEKIEKSEFRDTVISLHDKLRASLEGNAPEDGSTDTTATNSADEFPGEISLSEFPDIDLETAGNDDQYETKPLTTPQLQEFIGALKEVTARHSTERFTIKIAGGPVIAEEHADSIHKDFAKLLPSAFLLVFVLLFAMLGRAGAAFIPLFVVFLTLFSTLGFMGWIGSPVTPVVIALPPILLTIGVADAVHLLSSFYGHHKTSQDREASIIYAVKRTGLAILFTSLTTIAGFLAFLIADIKPIADFGILVAFGVIVAFIFTVVLLPAIIVLTGSSSKASDGKRWELVTSLMGKITHFSVSNQKAVLASMVLIIVVSIPGVTQLKFSHNMIEWFQKDNFVRVNTLWMDDIFHGTIPLEIIVDTGKENALYSPDFMRKLETFEAYTESLESDIIKMGRSTSIVDTLKRIHWVMNGENPETSIPNSEMLVAQELLLFESSGADDVSELIDSQFSKARITVRLSWVDAVDYVPVRQQIAEKANEIFASDAKVTTTGTIDLISRALVGVMQSMSSSYLIALIVIGFMLVILMRSFWLGLVSMVPNFMPILVSLGIMGYLGLPIDMFTVLLGGIALGLAVDDTVHFMHGFRFHRIEQGKEFDEAIAATIRDIGPALLFTTVAMALGFFIFIFSAMDALLIFGIMLGVTIINALLFDLLFVPAILKTIERFSLLSPVGEAATEQKADVQPVLRSDD